MLSQFVVTTVTQDNPTLDISSINIRNAISSVHMNIMKICNVPSRYGISSFTH